MTPIRFRCQCGALLAPVTPMTHATAVIRRTCRRCRATWQIVTRQISTLADGTAVHRGDLVCVRDAKP